MRFLSVPTCRGLFYWQGLLLAVSLLIFGCLPITAQLAVVSTNATEGKDVHLHLRNKPANYAVFLWYRGEGVDDHRGIASLFTQLRIHSNGPTYSSREEVNNDGSLLIKKVTLKDTGIYTVAVLRQGSRAEIGFGRLNVYQPVRVPTLIASSTTVTENRNAVLMTCYTNAVSIQWLFNGLNLQLTERMKLSQDHKILTIDPVKREDAGNYQCEVSNPISSIESQLIQLDVNY